MIETIHCAFNIIYSLDSHKVIGNSTVSAIRTCLAKEIAKKIECIGETYDYVSPIPHTGKFYSKIIAKHLGIPHVEVFEKNNKIKTLGLEHNHRFHLNKKNFDLVHHSIENLNILFIDEALVSGQTAKVISDLALSYGIHRMGFAFVSPPVTSVCPWSLNHRDQIYINKLLPDIYGQLETLQTYLQTNEIFFLSEDEFNQCFEISTVCQDCFGCNIK